MGVPRREANEANEAAEWLATLTTTKCAGPEAARLTYPRLVSGAAGQHFLSRRQPCAARAALPTVLGGGLGLHPCCFTLAAEEAPQR